MRREWLEAERFDVGTALGKVVFVVTSDKTVYIDRHSSAGGMNHRVMSTLVVRKVEYAVTAHADRDPSGSWIIGSLYATRCGTFDKASAAASKAIEKALVEALNTWVKGNSAALLMGCRYAENQALYRLEDEASEMEQKLAELKERMAKHKMLLDGAEAQLGLTAGS